MAKVVALQRGHDGREVREEGEEFNLDLDDPRFKGSTWFVPVEQKPEPKVESRAQRANARPPGQGPKPGSAAKADGVDDIA